jgi:hypothetical protein
MIRLTNQVNESLIIFRSNVGYYKPRKNGVCGWEKHPVALLWKGHELQLAKYSLEVAKEWLYNRPLNKGRPVESLDIRRKTVSRWTTLIEELQERNFPDTLPSLIGEEDFHSAFRAALLHKEICRLTFQKFKQGEYPDHAVIRNKLPHKTSWKRHDYEEIWKYFGKPSPIWYAQFNWTEEPTDKLIFYTEDRYTIFQDRKTRQEANPMQPWLNKEKRKNVVKT